MSSHRQEAKRLAKQIAELEAKRLDRKPWQLTGEVSKQQRPVNSLLEAELDFDRATRPAPVVTQEATTELEELIKRRVADVRCVIIVVVACGSVVILCLFVSKLLWFVPRLVC